MRTILVNIAEGGSVAVSSHEIGMSGEHRQTKFDFIVTDSALLGCTYLRLWFGDRYSEKLFLQNGLVSYVIPQEILNPPDVYMQVMGYLVQDGTVNKVARSEAVRFTVETSITPRLIYPEAIEPYENLSLECGRASSEAKQSADAAETSRNEAADSAASALTSKQAAAASQTAADLSADRAVRTVQNILDAVDDTLSETHTMKLMEQNSAADVGLWIGTKAEFNLITPHNNTLYLFTDDYSADDFEALMATVESFSDAISSLQTAQEEMGEEITYITSLLEQSSESLISYPSLSELFLRIYPVGSIYMSTSATNPANYFGGTWVAWGGGHVPVGYQVNDTSFNASEKIGGEKTHTLTVAEMPRHTHHLGNANASSQATVDVVSVTRTNGYEQTYETEIVGSSQPHNNMPPYIVCYMWKRTA